MIKNQLVSKYTKLKYRNHKSVVNNDEISNVLNREFNNKQLNEVVVSDLTYVQVGAKWHYICLLIDLFNREIIGYSAGTNKTSQLVQKAFCSITRPSIKANYVISYWTGVMNLKIKSLIIS